MRNFLQQLGRTRFIILLFILIIAVNFCYNSWRGMIVATLGCFIGLLIYDWKEYKPRIIKFLRRRTKLQLNIMIKSIILIPIMAASFYYVGWRGLAASIVGVVVGELICRRLFK